MNLLDALETLRDGLPPAVRRARDWLCAPPPGSEFVQACAGLGLEPERLLRHLGLRPLGVRRGRRGRARRAGRSVF